MSSRPLHTLVRLDAPDDQWIFPPNNWVRGYTATVFHQLSPITTQILRLLRYNRGN